MSQLKNRLQALSLLDRAFAALTDAEIEALVASLPDDHRDAIDQICGAKEGGFDDPAARTLALRATAARGDPRDARGPPGLRSSRSSTRACASRGHTADRGHVDGDRRLTSSGRDHQRGVGILFGGTRRRHRLVLPSRICVARGSRGDPLANRRLTSVVLLRLSARTISSTL